MPEKPTTAAGYPPERIELVRSTCLYVATKLGDLAEELVIVGGLVPSLLINQQDLPSGADPHVGTMDLDVGLSLGLLDESRYRTLADRLRAAGFSPGSNEEGNLTRQTWRVDGTSGSVTIDFLIAPSRKDDRGGKLRDIEGDFAAVIAPGLQLAFRDRQKLVLSGKTIFGEQATREVWVCGAGAYVVLKALAFRNRGENKDAYDLYYMLRNYGTGVKDVVDKLRPLLSDPDARTALETLRRDFLEHDGVGPRRVALFVYGRPDDTIQADVAGFTEQLVHGCARED